MKANLIKRPGIENPIYQTTLETFPSAIFSNIIFAKNQHKLSLSLNLRRFTSSIVQKTVLLVVFSISGSP